MKILYTLNSKDPGGMEQHVLDLVMQMTARGHEVFVWCKGGIISDWYKKAGAKVTEKTVRWDIDLKYINDLRGFLNKNKIDVLHAHELKAVGNGLLAAFLARTAVRISHIHTPFSDWRVAKWKRLLYNLCYAVAVRLFATKEIALTESIKQIKIHAGIPAEKLAVISNGIDMYKFFVSENERLMYRREVCKKYHLDSSTKIIGNLSRTTKEKGHDLLITAFAKLPKNYSLLICGGGDLEPSLWELACTCRVKDRVVITGRFDDDMKIKLYSAFDYFVFPTLAEGFGIVLIEALLMGLPVLCSDLEVLKEVGSVFPLYFKTGNLESLDQQLIRLTELDAADVKIGQLEHVKNNYSMEKFSENYEKLYRSLA